jgi:hypothetical protein
MAASNRKTLIDKINALPVEQIAEIEDFVDFLSQREKTDPVVNAMTAASAPAFARVWTNPDDNVYDAL